MGVTKQAGPPYDETGAAAFLGVSIEQLRVLIRSHIITEDSDISKVGMTQFESQDLLLLRWLMERGEAPSILSALARETAPEGEKSSGGDLESVPAEESGALPVASVVVVGD